MELALITLGAAVVGYGGMTMILIYLESRGK